MRSRGRGVSAGGLSAMKLGIAVCALAALAGLAELVIAASFRIREPGQFFAVLFALALTLGAFVALTDARVVKWLRRQAARSAVGAACLPFLLLVPYAIEAAGTHTLDWRAALMLAGYVAVPAWLLLPDRLHEAHRVGWRDFAAMLALALPIASGALSHIWAGLGGIPFFQPLYAVCAGGYAFLVVRNLHDVGYKLVWRKQDLAQGGANFVGFAIIAVPLGLAIHFMHFHAGPASAESVITKFVGVYVLTAIPEEFLFRGILQNFLEKSLPGERSGVYALLIASAIFGASHLQHAPVPNWRYAVLATIAGIFYGNAYRDRRRLSACALTHALVDTTKFFLF